MALQCQIGAERGPGLIILSYYLKDALLFACLQIDNRVTTHVCFPLEWTMPVLSWVLLWLRRLYITMQKKQKPANRKNTDFHISLRLSFQTKDYFLAASHAGIALQGLPRLKGKDVADVRRLSLASLSLADNVYNLAISFIISLFFLQMGRTTRHKKKTQQHWICHTSNSLRKRSPEQSVMCADLDRYYEWQWHKAK